MNIGFLTEMSLNEIVKESASEMRSDPGRLQQWLDEIIPKGLNFLVQIALTLLILGIGVKVISFIVKVFRRSLERGNLEKGVITFLSSLVKYSLYFILVMIILGQFGVTAGSVVAVLGSAGLTLGLAMQGSLANFAGGVLILLVKPFVVGDYIIVGTDEGTVVSITTFYTKLLTVDNKAIVIPNGTLSNSTITNVSNMETRRVDIRIGVDYSSDLSVVRRVIEEVLDQETRILREEPINIFVAELAQSSVDMEVRVWVRNEEYWQTKWDLTEALKVAFDKNGIIIPYPHVTIVAND